MIDSQSMDERPAAPHGHWTEVFPVFLRLGCTSFGGPVAHLGYFRDAFVARRRWLSESAYADLVALAQFLPGPASSQVGLAIGLSRAGVAGALAAWVGFTLPSALLLLAFALGVVAAGDALGGGWLHGLKVAAVAVVANAVWGMAARLCPDRPRATFAVLAAVFVTAVAGPAGQIGAILLAALAGFVMLRDSVDAGRAADAVPVPVSRRLGIACLAVFLALLAGLPVLASVTDSPALDYLDAFYRAGALVFGGGHVVLPLLESQVVAPGWIDRETFLAGYGAAQAVPGPLFTLSAYLGAVMQSPPNAWLGGALCLVAIFLPSFLLVLGTMPFWAVLRGRGGVQAALAGVNAGVVGLLAAALYDPVWTSAIQGPRDFALGLSAFLLLAGWRVQPAIVVVATSLAGAGLAVL
jgi:chromate transporter